MFNRRHLNLSIPGSIVTIPLFLILFCSQVFASVSGEIAISPKDDFATSISLVDDIEIAMDHGVLKTKYHGKSDKVIIHIQDAHCNFEAQQNITNMLAQLVKEYGVDMISVEGAEGIVDTSWFKSFPDAEIRDEVASYFMKKGEITGTEFYSIISDYDGTIFGAETKKYYVRNLEAFLKTYPHKSNIEQYLSGLQTIANRLKLIIYPPKLKELDIQIRAFDSKEIELNDFAVYLKKYIEKYDLSIKDYVNFEKLINTLVYEDKVDFDIVDQERDSYIDLLSKKMSQEEMVQLVETSVKFKEERITASDFYSYLRDKAKTFNIAIYDKFPNLFYYYIYTKLYDGIDTEILFSEIGDIKTVIKEILFTDELQRTLDTYSKTIDLYSGMVKIELTNDDYDLFKNNYSEFSLEDIVNYLKKLSDKYNLNYTIDDVPSSIIENIPNMIDFFEVATIRDEVLISNTLKKMDEEGKKISVLITGGFHTRGIKRILEEKGISYVVVMPRITTDEETPYFEVLTNSRPPLDSVISHENPPSSE